MMGKLDIICKIMEKIKVVYHGTTFIFYYFVWREKI